MFLDAHLNKTWQSFIGYVFKQNKKKSPCLSFPEKKLCSLSCDELRVSRPPVSYVYLVSDKRDGLRVSPTRKVFCSGSSSATKKKPRRKMIAQGINARDVKKLQDAGIHTYNGLMMHTKKNLTGIKGLSEAKVDKICEAAEKIVNFGYMTGSDALLKRKSVVRITTGCQALDDLLGGGIGTAAITEAFGEFRSGKTKLAHTLCVTTQVGYFPSVSILVNSWILPLMTEIYIHSSLMLKIIYPCAYTYEHQFNLLLGLAAKMSEEPLKILIVDSIIALFRVDFTRRGELADRQQKLAQMLSRIIKIAEEFNF
ncbi:unnamed protein product [Eruca vesicaria subsp. sativa]|uniref:RecA family profile 1 domain-containing protein n=1 Tax=Eruca vesicaria subsp. sativa TaxID=29727 RepID=A0ABC8KE27_ERUVS|nr:unnamed protein product [Eruca vesicaria subsp. sativa]